MWGCCRPVVYCLPGCEGAVRYMRCHSIRGMASPHARRHTCIYPQPSGHHKGFSAQHAMVGQVCSVGCRLHITCLVTAEAHWHGVCWGHELYDGVVTALWIYFTFKDTTPPATRDTGQHVSTLSMGDAPAMFPGAWCQHTGGWTIFQCLCRRPIQLLVSAQLGNECGGCVHAMASSVIGCCPMPGARAAVHLPHVHPWSMRHTYKATGHPSSCSAVVLLPSNAAAFKGGFDSNRTSTCSSALHSRQRVGQVAIFHTFWNNGCSLITVQTHLPVLEPTCVQL